MHNRHITSITLIGLAALLLGCATPRMEMSESSGKEPPGAIDTDPADPRLDHIIAWIPRDRAKTAAVAEALVYIELGQAKDDVGRELCDGDWLMNGASVDRVGPYPSTAPAALGGYPAWYFHVSHQPGLAGCPAIPTDRLYRELGARLPQWIIVKAASPQARAAPASAIATTTPQHR
jgi:hypothetical protein